MQHLTQQPYPNRVLRFESSLDPFPSPVTAAPGNNELTNINNAVLYWHGSTPPYQLQIATDASFESIIVDSLDIQESLFKVENLTENQQFFWRVRVRNGTDDPASDWSNTTSFSLTSLPVSAEPEQELAPIRYELEANYPNPFYGVTTIQYGLPAPSSVRLEVYDILGRQVKTLVNGRQQAGWHEVAFDASNLPSGMYLYRLQADSFVKTKTMVVIR